jgi:hypothetical protein
MASELDDTRQLRDVFVRPYYLRLLHGNFIWKKAGTDYPSAEQISDAARTISDSQIQELLQRREWRGRLAAAWYVGLTARTNFVDQIADLLLASEMTYSGQGYCVALGLIGGQACQSSLRKYLEKYLPLRGRFYDQTWAIGALGHIQAASAGEFFDPMLWTEGTHSFDPREEIRNFEELVTYLRDHRMIVHDHTS